MHLLLALIVLAGTVVQTGKDPLLARLEGNWSGTGVVLNQPSQISLTWT